MHGDCATALYDAICLGSERLGPKEGRKVLVLVSDGGDTAKSTTYAAGAGSGAAQRGHDLLHHRRAHRGQRRAATWAASTRSSRSPSRPAASTSTSSAGGLDKAFAQVSDDLRTQYLIGYYPHNQEPGRQFHRIEVTIPRAAPDAFNIRRKTGYYMNTRPRATDLRT